MSDMQRPFALALSANRVTEQSSHTASTAAACYARSEAEADGRGVQMAKERWPAADGWGSHQAVSLELRKEWCAAAVAFFEAAPCQGGGG